MMNVTYDYEVSPFSAKLREPALRDEGAAALLGPDDGVGGHWHRRGRPEPGRRHDPQGHRHHRLFPKMSAEQQELIH